MIEDLPKGLRLALWLLLALSALLQETTQAMRSIDQLLNYLQQHPEALLSGKRE